MTLRLAWVDRTAAEFACRHWHYSHCTPAGRLMILGVWENDIFKGVVIFGRGATPNIGNPYGLAQGEICELTRIALDTHATPVSRIVAIAIRLLRQQCPGLRMIISYAAGEEGHHGGVYQAGGWIYEGAADSYTMLIKGKRVHGRSLISKYGTGSGSLEWVKANLDPHAERITDLIRHKYLMPLDIEIRAAIEPLAQPYPKRAK